MIKGLSVDQVRVAEQAAFAALGEDGRDGGSLMQRAAAGIARIVRRQLTALTGGVYGSSMLIVVGAGNNGGDALYVGTRLAREGVRVWLYRTGAGVHQAGWAAACASGAREVDHDTVLGLIVAGRVDLVLDGVCGIGGRPGLSTPVAEIARACARQDVFTVAVDVPSGLAAEGVMVRDDHFRADLTIALGHYKPCHLVEPARSACGRLEWVELGLSDQEFSLLQWEISDVVARWPRPSVRSDKYSRGVVGCLSGSNRYPGAAVLSVAGAVAGGAGMVRYLGPSAVGALVLQRFPSVVVGEGRCQAYVCGSGWEATSDRHVGMQGAIASGLPVVLDAGALANLPQGPLGRQVVLTPHAGEMARLLGVERAEVEASPVWAVRAAVQHTGATVMLKGATHYVAGPEGGPVQLAVSGPAWTAQAGSGDVLAGVCAALLAAGVDPAAAAVMAASAQALAATDRRGAVPPEQVIAGWPHVLEEISQ